MLFLHLPQQGNRSSQPFVMHSAPSSGRFAPAKLNVPGVYHKHPRVRNHKTKPEGEQSHLSKNSSRACPVEQFVVDGGKRISGDFFPVDPCQRLIPHRLFDYSSGIAPVEKDVDFKMGVGVAGSGALFMHKDVHAEFLAALSLQCLFRAFAVLDPSTGEFPHSGKMAG